MTRISAGINPLELCDSMLLAEHREIKRIPNSISSGKAVISYIPYKFTLGKGHVKFFYDKIRYLHNRYKLIREECLDRGFVIGDYNEAFEKVPKDLYNDWFECPNCRAIVKDRINEKLSNMKVIKYYKTNAELHAMIIR